MSWSLWETIKVLSAAEAVRALADAEPTVVGRGREAISPVVTDRSE